MSDAKFCSNCGEEVSKDAKFCEKCGTELDVEETALAEKEEKTIDKKEEKDNDSITDESAEGDDFGRIYPVFGLSLFASIIPLLYVVTLILWDVFINDYFILLNHAFVLSALIFFLIASYFRDESNFRQFSTILAVIQVIGVIVNILTVTLWMGMIPLYVVTVCSPLVVLYQFYDIRSRLNN